MDDFNQDTGEISGKKQFPKRKVGAATRRPELPAEVIDRIDRHADALGYGQKGRVKFLHVVLDVIESMPTLFRKR